VSAGSVSRVPTARPPLGVIATTISGWSRDLHLERPPTRSPIGDFDPQRWQFIHDLHLEPRSPLGTTASNLEPLLPRPPIGDFDPQWWPFSPRSPVGTTTSNWSRRQNDLQLEILTPRGGGSLHDLHLEPRPPIGAAARTISNWRFLHPMVVFYLLLRVGVVSSVDFLGERLWPFGCRRLGQGHGRPKGPSGSAKDKRRQPTTGWCRTSAVGRQYIYGGARWFRIEHQIDRGSLN
jgi:hypothetical protein